MLDTKARKYLQPAMDQIARRLLRSHLTPNHVTVAAAIIGVAAGVVFGAGWTPLAVFLLWFSGLLDVVDGSMARLSHASSPLGALMDVVFDRLVEISILLALIYRTPERAIPVALVLSCIILSMTVFLTAGALIQNTSTKSFHYQAGLAERSEGFVMLTLAMCLPTYQTLLLLLFAGMILYTAIHRFVLVAKFLKQ